MTADTEFDPDEPEEALRPKYTFNPVRQRQMACIEDRALNPGQPLPSLDPLIKKHAEQRSSRSWEFSIANSIHQITHINKLRKSGGHYADETLLRESLWKAFPIALKRDSLEAFEGKFDEFELEEKINKNQILEEAFSLL